MKTPHLLAYEHIQRAVDLLAAAGNVRVLQLREFQEAFRADLNPEELTWIEGFFSVEGFVREPADTIRPPEGAPEPTVWTPEPLSGELPADAG